MKITVNQQNLAKALSIVGRAVSSRSTMPILANVLLEATADDRLRVVATNREISINAWIGADVEESGSITIPARLLSEFVNSLPPDTIDMDLIQRTLTLHLNCARFYANMKGIAADDFPLLPTAETVTGYSYTVQPDALKRLIETTTFAASTDENRQTLTNVQCVFADGTLQMAATDGFRLSVNKAAATGAAEMTAIVPARNLFEVARICATDDPITVAIGEQRNHVLFAATGTDSLQRVEVVSELTDVRFPDYSSIVPKSYNTRTTVPADVLKKAVEMALLFARDSSNIIRLAAAGESLTVTGDSPETGGNVGKLDARTNGEPIDIALDGRFVKQYLETAKGAIVTIETTQPTRPAAFRVLHDDVTADKDYTHVIMPMHR